MAREASQYDPGLQPSPFRELTVFFAKVVAAGLLAAGCALAPIIGSALLSPWLGMLLAVSGFWVWSRFGPRPSPGLLHGLMCLWGFAAILGSFVTCSLQAVRGFFA